MMATPGDFTDYDYVKVRLGSGSDYLAIYGGGIMGSILFGVITLDYAGGTKRMQLDLNGDVVELSSLDEM